MTLEVGANFGIVDRQYSGNAIGNENEPLIPRANDAQAQPLDTSRDRITDLSSSSAQRYPRATNPTEPRQANLQLLESVRALRDILQNPNASEPLSGISLPSHATFEDMASQLVDDWQLRFFRFFAPAERRELTEMLNAFRHQVDELVAIARQPDPNPRDLAQAFGTLQQKNAALASKLAARLDKCRPFVEPVRWSTLARVGANLLIGGGVTAVTILVSLGVMAVAWWVIPLLLPIAALAVTLVNVSLAAHEDRIGRKHDAWATLQGPVDAFGNALATARSRVEEQIKSAEVSGALKKMDEEVRRLTESQHLLMKENEALKEQNAEILQRLSKLEEATRMWLQTPETCSGSVLTPRLMSPVLLSVASGSAN